MRRILSSTEIIAPLIRNGRKYEVCATAEGDFDEKRSQLILELDSLIRPMSRRPGGALMEADWLPKKERMTETISQEEATTRVRDIFHQWSRKVRQSIPPPGERTTGGNYAAEIHN